jgi:hypothetical protein
MMLILGCISQESLKSVATPFSQAQRQYFETVEEARNWLKQL